MWISLLDCGFHKITSTINQQMHLYNIHFVCCIVSPSLRSIRRTPNLLHSLQQIPTQHDRLPQHLVYKNELNREYVITLARNDETPWWWSEKIETCRSGFKWKLYRCICWLIVNIVQCAVFSVQCAVYSVQCALCSVHCAFEQAYSISSTAKFLAKKKTDSMTYAATTVFSNKTNRTHTASSWLVVTRCSTPLRATLDRILDTATSDKSLAMISLTPGTSLAYRILRRPDADKASNIVRPSWNKTLQCSSKDSIIQNLGCQGHSVSPQTSCHNISIGLSRVHLCKRSDIVLRRNVHAICCRNGMGLGSTVPATLRDSKRDTLDCIYA